MRICKHNNKMCYYHDCNKYMYEEYIEKYIHCEDVIVMTAKEYRDSFKKRD